MVLLGKSLDELTQWVQQQGQPAYRGKQLHQWLYQKGARTLSEITVLPKQWRSLHAHYPLGRSTIQYRSIAPDQTRKYLLRLADGSTIETVGIPTAKRLTVCVSSQVGCPMDCSFCATGKGGFTRHLQPYEIVDQVLTVQSDFAQRVTNVVFMGMGEPLIDLDATVRAAKLLNQDVGIGARSLTISTVGIRDKIAELAQHQLQLTLAVSLHAPDQTLRQRLIPSAKHYPIQELIAECRQYFQITGRRVTFEYILLAGVNDSPRHAKALAQLLEGFSTHVNLIPYNPIAEADYQRPSETQIKHFVDVLEASHLACSVRYSRGLEADAACGQLRQARAANPNFIKSQR